MFQAQAAVINDIISPRGIQHWRRDLGFYNRVKIQGLQIGQHALRAAAAIESSRDIKSELTTRVDKIESRIVELQAEDRRMMRTEIERQRAVIARQEDEIQELRTIASRLNASFRSAPIGFLVVGTDGVIRDINDYCVDRLGLSRSEIIGQDIKIFDLFILDQRENARIRFEERIKGVPEEQLTPRIGPRQCVRSDNSTIYVETFNRVLRDKRGTAVGVLTSFQDITEQVLARKKLQEAQDSLIDQERMRAAAEVAANLSHGLNNSLQVLLGIVEKLLVEGAGAVESPSERDRLLKLARKSLAQVVKIAAGALSLSRVSSEEKTVICVKEQLEQLTAALEIMAQGKNIELQCDFSGIETEDGVLISETGFVDMMTNLIRNAFESFNGQNENRRVVVSARKEDADKIIIEVVDFGCGIKNAMVGQLFTEPVKSTKGTGGVGLWTVKRKVIDAVPGASITVESAVGMGSSFIVILPRTKYMPAPPPTDITTPLTVEESSRVGVLVVEDEPYIGEMIVETLRRNGFINVSTFTTVREALGSFPSNGDDPRRIRIVITDENVGREYGHVLVRTIAERRGDIHFIMMSGVDPVDGDPVSAARSELGALFWKKPLQQDCYSEILRLAREILASEAG